MQWEVPKPLAFGDLFGAVLNDVVMNVSYHTARNISDRNFFFYNSPQSNGI